MAVDSITRAGKQLSTLDGRTKLNIRKPLVANQICLQCKLLYIYKGIGLICQCSLYIIIGETLSTISSIDFFLSFFSFLSTVLNDKPQQPLLH